MIDELYTQKDIIERVRRVLGSIDVDPASCDEAQKIVQAKTYYTKETNGLKDENGNMRRWVGNVWMNAPYSKPWAEEFAYSLVGQFCMSITRNAIALYNNKTETGYHQTLASYSAYICNPKSRLKFYGPGDKGHTARNGQTIFLLSDDPKVQRRFVREFGPLGLITQPVRVA